MGWAEIVLVVAVAFILIVARQLPGQIWCQPWSGGSRFVVAFPALTPFSFQPNISQVMGITCQVAEMISGAWGLAAGDCGAERSYCPTLSLREPSRRSKYPDRNSRLGLLALSLYQ
jgi:hypothetical protein